MEDAELISGMKMSPGTKVSVWVLAKNCWVGNHVHPMILTRLDGKHLEATSPSCCRRRNQEQSFTSQ